MQFMEEIRYVPTPVMTSARNTTVRKTLFPLIVGFSILIGLIVGGETAEGGDIKNLNLSSKVTAMENVTEKLTFSGRVVDNNGAAVEDAEVL